MTVTFSEEERQAVVLALACLALARPGWDDFLGRTAVNLDPNGAMYRSFKESNSDRGPGTGYHIHVLVEGLPLCRFSLLAPALWPEGQIWVGESEAVQANCVVCLQRASARLIERMATNALPPR
jgi:hypothetical protein